MKKFINIMLSSLMTLSFAACGTSTSEGNATVEQAKEAAETAAATVQDAVNNKEELVDDDTWSKLESLGKIQTENGQEFVSVTLPAELAGENVTQEALDAEMGQTYTAATLNEDGSVTYKMTKEQHTEMVNSVKAELDSSLKEIIDSTDYTVTDIKHSDDFTTFDVTLESEELGVMDSFTTVIFYLYGGMYSIFTGTEAQDITVNFYGPSGTLIQSVNSADLQN